MSETQPTRREAESAALLHGDLISPEQEAAQVQRIQAYTIDHTQDEYGEHRWVIADERGDWIGDAYSTRDEAADVIASDAVPTVRYCAACSHFHEPDEPCRCPECGKPATTPGGTCGDTHAR